MADDPGSSAAEPTATGNIPSLQERLNATAAAILRLPLVPTEEPKRQQELRVRLAGLQRTVRAMIDEVRLQLRRRLNRPRRTELSRLYVSAVLLALYLDLLFVRWNVPPTWYAQAAAYHPLERDVEAALRRFDHQVSRRWVRMTSLTYNLITTALRVWIDRFSASAGDVSGWQSVAPDVTKALRLRYELYRTRQLWALAFEPSPSTLNVGGRDAPGLPQPPSTRRGLYARAWLILRAAARTLFGIVAGYGLRVGRFALATTLTVGAFGALYWLLDVASGCGRVERWTDLPAYILASLGTFTSLGRVAGPSCSADGRIVSMASSAESLFGYFMLAVLASILLALINESAPRVAGFRMVVERTTDAVEDVAGIFGRVNN